MNAIRILSLPLLALTLCYPLSAFAAEVAAPSAVTAVTLFEDRAQVVRSATVTLPAGDHTVLLGGIPQGVDADSLRANGTGPQGTSLGSVELRSEPLRNDLSAQVDGLKKTLDRLNLDAAAVERARALIDQQRKMLGQISLDGSTTDGTAGSSTRPRTPKEISELLLLISESERRFEPELRSLSERAAKIAEERSFTQSKLNQLQSGDSEQVIAVELKTSAPGEVTLNTTYQISGASWRPTYRLAITATPEGKAAATLETGAIISQRTGESWNKIALTLSTARTALGLLRPEPDPVLLDVAAPPPAPVAFGLRARAVVAPQAKQLEELAVVGASADAAVMIREEAQQNSGPVVTYTVARKVTLANDGSEEKVALSSQQLGGALRNTVVPRNSPEVFREVSLTLGDAPLLPGEMVVLFDGEFVGKRPLAATAAGAELAIPVGVSQTLTVTRKLAKRFEDDSGLVRSVRRIRNEYQFEVKNTASYPQQLALLEPMPVSRNEQITVAIDGVTPPWFAGERSARVAKNDGVNEWQLTVAPKSSTTTGYSSTVEFPAKVPVSGIEGL